MPIVVAFMVVTSLISGNLHSPLWHSDAILGRSDYPIKTALMLMRAVHNWDVATKLLMPIIVQVK